MKLSLGSCRARQRQNLQNLQTKQSNYAETVEKLEQVNLDNRELEVEKQRLEAELSQLNGVQHIRPSAPASSNGYSDSDSNNSSTGPAVFTTRVGRDIIVEPAHAVKYRKTEQLWFSKVTSLPMWVVSVLTRTVQTVTVVGALSGTQALTDDQSWRGVRSFVACAKSWMLRCLSVCGNIRDLAHTINDPTPCQLIISWCLCTRKLQTARAVRHYNNLCSAHPAGFILPQWE